MIPILVPVPDPDALLQGANTAMHAWAGASSEYAVHRMGPWVALWAAGIAAAVVLLEWVLSRGRG
jgi:hypothetical protein